MSLPAIDISPSNWEIVSQILSKYVPQYEVWAFGSRVTGKAKKYSDLDLALISESPIPLDIRAELSEAFSESDLPWKVDIVDWATTSDTFKMIIEKQKIVLQQKNINIDE